MATQVSLRSLLDSDDAAGCAKLSLDRSDTLHDTPAVRLMRAVLVQAVGDLKRYATASNRGGRKLFARAAAWVASDDVEWPFSFRSICEALDVDPCRVRAIVSQWNHSGSGIRDRTRLPILPPLPRFERNERAAWQQRRAVP
jgi:hypothetical protein